MGTKGDSSNGVSVTATITTAAPTVPTRDNEEPAPVHERRPSWRLRVDNGSKVCIETFYASIFCMTYFLRIVGVF